MDKDKILAEIKQSREFQRALRARKGNYSFEDLLVFIEHIMSICQMIGGDEAVEIYIDRACEVWVKHIDRSSVDELRSTLEEIHDLMEHGSVP